MSEESLEEFIEEQRSGTGLGRAMFRTRIFRVSELIDMLQSKKLRLVGDKPFKKWTISHKSRLIESLILGLPADSIIIDGSDSQWYVADGSEFLTAIRDYIDGTFSLEYVNFDMSSYAGALFKKLPLSLQGRLMNLEIIATVINPDVSEIHRLSIYNSSLLKIGKERELWNCAEAVYPESFKKVRQLAFELDVDNPHLLWQIMTAVFFASRFVTADIVEATIAGTRFDMFECLLLEHFDVIFAFMEHKLADYRTDISRINDLVQEVFDDEKNVWSDKKKTIFSIVVALLVTMSVDFTSEKLQTLFNRAWKKSLGRGVGHLYRDYAVKTSEIFNFMTK